MPAHNYDHGHAAYLAYFNAVEGKSIHGEPLPSFDDQSPFIQQAWRHAADGAIDNFLANLRAIRNVPTDIQS